MRMRVVMLWWLVACRAAPSAPAPVAATRPAPVSPVVAATAPTPTPAATPATPPPAPAPPAPPAEIPVQGRVVSATTGEAVDDIEVTFTARDHKPHRAELDKKGNLHLRLEPDHYWVRVGIRRTKLRYERVRLEPDGSTRFEWLITADDLERVKFDDRCTVHDVTEPAVRGQAAIDCGNLHGYGDPSERDAALLCMTQAVDARRAFKLSEHLASYDSVAEGGIYGRVEHGRVVVYRITYDSDPCGGGCPWKGGSQIEHCGPLELRPDRDACRSITSCVVCSDAAPQHCLRGGAPPDAPP